MTSSDKSGNNQRKNGSMIREDRATDLVSPDAVKINEPHNATGNQYFRKNRSFDTPHRKPAPPASRNAKASVNNSWHKSFDAPRQVP